MIAELTLMSIVTLITLAASGGALFVSMKVSSAQKDFSITLGTFKLELEHSLEEKFMSRKDCTMYEGMRKELELNYRGTTTGKIEDIEVQISRDRDDLTIALKGILTAIADVKGQVTLGRK